MSGSRSRADVAKTAPPFSVRICHMTRAMVCASKQFGVGVPCQFKSKNSMPPSSMGHFQRLPSDPARIRSHFKELHQKLIAELAPVRALEDHFVWTIARL